MSSLRRGFVTGCLRCVTAGQILLVIILEFSWSLIHPFGGLLELQWGEQSLHYFHVSVAWLHWAWDEHRLDYVWVSASFLSFRLLSLVWELFPSTPKEDPSSDSESVPDTKPLRNCWVTDFFFFSSELALLETGCFPFKVSGTPWEIHSQSSAELPSRLGCDLLQLVYILSGPRAPTSHWAIWHLLGIRLQLLG